MIIIGLFLLLLLSLSLYVLYQVQPTPPTPPKTDKISRWKAIFEMWCQDDLFSHTDLSKFGTDYTAHAINARRYDMLDALVFGFSFFDGTKRVSPKDI